MKQPKKPTRKEKAEASRDNGIMCPVRGECIPPQLCLKLNNQLPMPCDAKECKMRKITINPTGGIKNGKA